MTLTSTSTSFPIDLAAYRPLALDLAQADLTGSQRADLQANISLCRDAIVFFTATGAARGVGGHTGGPYDVVPEVVLLDALFRGNPDRFLPMFFDEAGHRVAIQYLMAVLKGHLPAEALLRYREAHARLPGHPELGLTPGVAFSSGRLGHLWPFINGLALAHPDRVLVCLGSDGAQQEGDDAEAARFAVAHGLNVKLLIDDNDVTIAGHPSDYMPGYDLERTLAGHGLATLPGDGEDLDDLHRRLRQAILSDGPVALINRRPMAVGIAGIEGSTHGHDVIPVDKAVAYLEARGRQEAADCLGAIAKPENPTGRRGSGERMAANRNVFGDTLVEILGKLSPEARQQQVLCVDSDLEGSCGLAQIRKAFPEIFVRGGIMERANFSAAAGFGMEQGRQGIFATFSAFLEMCISEITMARLNGANVLAHFSHAGIDDMADNTCHFGLNNLFADNGLEEGDSTRLYFPADAGQMAACVRSVFAEPGLRFVFSTRSKVPNLLNAQGQDLYGEDYVFQPGRDEWVRRGNDGVIVSFGESLYRCLDAVEQLRDEGLQVGVVNKATLNVVDEEMLAELGRQPFVLVVESFNRRTGLGSRFGTWLLERGLTPRYAYLGTWREGCGGLWEQFPHQGIDASGIISHVRGLLA
ncbi:MAG: transketolase C-terminal domain-containing protein [Prochlorococcaceae cyanobacterium]